MIRFNYIYFCLTFFLALLSQLIFSDIIIAQYNQPRLYTAAEEKCLIVWSTDNEQKGFSARFIFNNGTPAGERFPIYSNELISFNSSTDFMITKTINYTLDEYCSAFHIDAKIYDSVLDTIESFQIANHIWPECGTGHLGFQDLLIGLNKNFLYLNQFDGYLSCQMFENSGERIFDNFEEYNAFNISAAGLSDDSFLILWFNARSYDQLNLLPFGIYATYIENNEVRADSILIKDYSQIAENDEFFFWEDAPMFELKTLNDTTYQLFVVEPDSLFLYSYILSREAEIIEAERFPIPDIYNNSKSRSVFIEAINISNFAENARTLFLSTYFYDYPSSYVTNYLYYFSDEGSSSGEPIIDTTQVFQQDYFTFKTGDESFLNPSVNGDDVMIDTYNNFSLIASEKIGTVTSIEEKNSLPPERFSLSQNFPNPFNPSTTIQYSIPVVEALSAVEGLHVSLKVYDVLGREVATLVNEQKQPGVYKVNFDGSNLPSGIYIYRILTGSFSESRKMTLLN